MHACPPHHNPSKLRSMSDEPSARRRSASRRAVSELILPSEYFERLEQRRKQLDESIHKYIAAKEREYKTFERELRQEHKQSQDQDASNTVAKSASSEPRLASNEQSDALASERIAAVDALSMRTPFHSSPTIPRALDQPASISPEDRLKHTASQEAKTSYEREMGLEGFFTPAYLTALDAQARNRLERASSEPPIPTNANTPKPSGIHLERANSDSFEQAKQNRPSQLLLAHRTSSSEASTDGRLASALRSPTQRASRKRVSLAVGDSIVAPSDNVPPALTHNTTPSHSRRRSQLPERDFPVSGKRGIAGGDDRAMARAVSPLADEILLANGAAEEEEEGATLPSLPPAAKISRPTVGSASPSRGSKIDPDGDLFDLEHEDDSDPSANNLDYNDEVLESDDDEEEDRDERSHNESDITGRIHPSTKPTLPPPPTSAIRTRYDPAAGIIPEPPGGEDEDSAVPHLSFGPRSAAAPLQPGFRRPSVIYDPVYAGRNYQAAEQDAVQSDVYGSSAQRPSSKGSFTAGSLGESYMAQHAETMRWRLARAQQ